MPLGLLRCVELKAKHRRQQDAGEVVGRNPQDLLHGLERGSRLAPTEQKHCLPIGAEHVAGRDPAYGIDILLCRFELSGIGLQPCAAHVRGHIVGLDLQHLIVGSASLVIVSLQRMEVSAQKPGFDVPRRRGQDLVDDLVRVVLFPFRQRQLACPRIARS